MAAVRWRSHLLTWPPVLSRFPSMRAQEEDKNFVYLALERCRASLGDVVEGPSAPVEAATADWLTTARRKLFSTPEATLTFVSGCVGMCGVCSDVSSADWRLVWHICTPRTLCTATSSRRTCSSPTPSSPSAHPAAHPRVRSDATAGARPGRVKLADIGLGRKLDGRSSFDSHRGTVGWQAPGPYRARLPRGGRRGMLSPRVLRWQRWCRRPRRRTAAADSRAPLTCSRWAVWCTTCSPTASTPLARPVLPQRVHALGAQPSCVCSRPRAEYCARSLQPRRPDGRDEAVRGRHAAASSARDLEIRWMVCRKGMAALQCEAEELLEAMVRQGRG
jgi:hypothetical protein